jgi:hypothetical protein
MLRRKLDDLRERKRGRVPTWSDRQASATMARVNRPTAGLALAARNLRDPVIFGLLPLTVVILVAAAAVQHDFAFDFRVFWHAGRDVLHERSPYPTPATVARASTLEPHSFFVYPPIVALIVIPLSILPFAVAAAIYTACLLLCFWGALRVLGVTDWRCHSVVLVSVPVLSAIRLGSITPLLVLAIAIAWRHRELWPIAGAAVGAAIVAKLFVWPLLLWLVLTRRFKAAAAAAIGASALTMLAWAVLGFRGLVNYPSLLHNLSDVEGSEGFSLMAATARIGLPASGYSWLLLAVPASLALLAMCRRAGSARGVDERLFSATIGITLLLTPILWLHYYALLIVPLALRRRTFGLEWMLLLGFWISPFEEPTHFALWRIALATALVVLLAGRVDWSRVRASGSTALERGASGG